MRWWEASTSLTQVRIRSSSIPLLGNGHRTLTSSPLHRFPQTILSATVLTVLLKQNPGLNKFLHHQIHIPVSIPQYYHRTRSFLPSRRSHLISAKIPLNVPNPSEWHWELVDRGPGSRIIISSMMMPASHQL